jgi:hypothetical protein
MLQWRKNQLAINASAALIFFDDTFDSLRRQHGGQDGAFDQSCF